MDGQDEPGFGRDELASLLSLSGTLAGVCIGIIAFISGSGRGTGTIVDDVLAACAAVFLLCIYLIVWSMRSRRPARAALLARCVEVVFLTNLTVMTTAGFAMVYTVW